MTSLAPPASPTLVYIHPKENLQKCSVWPVRALPCLDVQRWSPETSSLDLPGEGPWIRLGLGGPPLSVADVDRRLLVLDATWRYAAAMEAGFADIPIRTLPAELITAFPRRSKLYTDPDGGLATIEAIDAAHRITGRPTAGLLDGYRWAKEWRELNADRLPSVRN
ncbi:MAG: hypothetical protein AB8G96_07960 [Phycisphaerales bacterium]